MIPSHNLKNISLFKAQLELAFSSCLQQIMPIKKKQKNNLFLHKKYWLINSGFIELQ